MTLSRADTTEGILLSADRGLWQRPHRPDP